MRNLFSPGPMGNDLPQQGGFTGTGLTAPPIMPQLQQNPMSNMFTTPQMTPPMQQFNPAADDIDINARMSQLYTPENTATDKFNQLVSNYPKREDNKPSMLRRIGGALMAVGGSLPVGRDMGFYHANPQAIEQGMRFIEKPFEDKQEDWKTQIGPAGQAAQFERYKNVNERTMAYQTVSNQLKQEAENHRQQKNDVDAQIKQHRAQVYEFKALHPGLKFDFRGPSVLAADPISGQVHDTGIPTGSMSELDKLNLSQDFRMEQIGEAGNQARRTEEVKQTGRETLENKKQTGREVITDKKISAKTGAGGKPESPTQTRVRQFNIARELYNTRPDLRPFIKLGNPGANDFTVQPPVEGFFGHRGPSQALYEEAKNKIYGDSAPQPVSTHSPNGPAPIVSSASGVTQNGPNLGMQPPQRGSSDTGDEVKIADMSGKVIGTIHSSDVAKLDKTKYKVVK